LETAARNVSEVLHRGPEERKHEFTKVLRYLIQIWLNTVHCHG